MILWVGSEFKKGIGRGVTHPCFQFPDLNTLLGCRCDRLFLPAFFSKTLRSGFYP